MSGFTMTQAELLWVLTTPVTKNTYTTEAAFTGVLGTNPVCKLDGNYFRSDNPNPIGRSLHWEAYGTIATTATATFAVNLGFDPTAGTKNASGNLAVAGALAPTASLTLPWRFDAWLTCTAFVGSQMTLQINGTWRVESVASGGVPSASAQCSGFAGSISGATVDPRVDNYLELFGTWSASAAGNTTTVQQEFLWGLN